MTHRSNAGVFTQVRTVKGVSTHFMRLDFKHSGVDLVNLWPKRTQTDRTSRAAFKAPIQRWVRLRQSQSAALCREICWVIAPVVMTFSKVISSQSSGIISQTQSQSQAAPEEIKTKGGKH